MQLPQANTSNARHISPPITSKEKDLLDRFYRLPRSIDRMLLERGLITVYQRASLERSLAILEQGVEEEAREAICGPKGYSELTLNQAQRYLERCSADALAFHLYTRELLRLTRTAAGEVRDRDVAALTNFPKYAGVLRTRR